LVLSPLKTPFAKPLQEIAMTDLIALKRSIALENEADGWAVQCRFHEANALMREANAIRKAEFGCFDPNTLRDLTHAAIQKEK
jgi:hypothetical protein